MSDWEVIERAAAELGVSAEAVRKWRIRGVSQFYRLQIVKIAQRDGLDFDDAAFDAMPGPKSKSRNGGPE